MPTPLDYDSNPSRGESHSFTLHPQAHWTPLSKAAVGCCWLFVAGVAASALVHPSIPPALVVLIVLAAPAAAVLGLIAQHRSGGGRARGARGAMLFGSAVTLITLAIAFLLPTLCRSSEQADRVKCASNLRQIGQALSAYADAHAGRFPPDLAALAAASELTPATFICASSNDTPAVIDKSSDWAAALKADTHQLSYVYLAAGLSKSDVTSESVLVGENAGNHLGEGMNLLFGDLHVEWFPKGEGQRMMMARHASTGPTTQAESH